MKIVKDKKSITALIAAICTALITTSSLKIGLSIGLATSIVLILANVFMNIFKNRAPANMLMLFYIVLTAFFTGIVNLIFQAYIPEVYGALGIYVPLIIFSVCIIVQVIYGDGSYSIGRVTRTSIYFTLAISAISIIRELIGKGLASTLEHPTALIIIGFLFAIVSGIINKKQLV